MKIHLTYITKYLSAALLFVTVPSSGQNAFMKVVAQDGTGDYRSINEAVGSCTQDGTRNFIFKDQCRRDILEHAGKGNAVFGKRFAGGFDGRHMDVVG